MVSIDYQKTGQIIKDKRQKMGLTQQKLAEMLGISDRFLSSLENGRAGNINSTTSRALAKIFKCNEEDFIIHEEKYIINDVDEANESVEEVVVIHKLEKSYYASPNPFHKISSFPTLFLILPLVDDELLMEMCARVDGDIFGREDYISQLMDWLLSTVKPSPAKKYVERLLALIESTPWAENNLSITDSLQLGYDKLWEDEEFNRQYNAYVATIQKKRHIAKLVNELIRTSNS